MDVNYRILLALIASLTLGACSTRSEDTEPASEPPPVEDTAFGDLVGTVDKAKGVQDTVDAHKQELDRQLRVNEGEAEAAP
jgi:hypothetical protein